VEAGQEAFDDHPGFDFQAPDLRDDGGIEEPELVGLGNDHNPLLGSGTTSSSRSMMESELMCSDSA